MAAVNVPLTTGGYDVLIGTGLLGDIADVVAERCPASRYAVVTDETVAPLYGRAVTRALSGLAPTVLIAFPAGERHKTRDTWVRVTDSLARDGVGRDGAIVAVGGGVVGDVAGFVAATYLRGVPYVQVPTTLLAMLDSSVGGKTGVDLPAGKNLVGAFHQPRVVVVDVETLGSLPEDHRAAGAAESIKHGAIQDASHFDWIADHASGILAGAPDVVEPLVRRSVEIKAAVVGEDELEHGKRAVLNFGHTVAHALEAASDYALLHGAAVAIGMNVEAQLGTDLGITDRDTAPRIVRSAGEFGLGTAIPPGIQAARALNAMKQDKKSRRGSARFTLLKRIGEVARSESGEWTIPVSEEWVRALRLG